MKELPIYLLPGGKMPKRMSEEAIGYDVYIRAVVCDTEKDPDNDNFRLTLFDFKNRPEDEKVNQHVFEKDGELIYRMDPHESVLIGIGFATAMPFPMFYWVAPRSGLATKHGITITNAPGTVDPDYRGEAGALVYNRNLKPFDLRHNMRIAQIIFQKALIPELGGVETHEELTQTERGAKGFGSTGISD